MVPIALNVPPCSLKCTTIDGFQFLIDLNISKYKRSPPASFQALLCIYLYRPMSWNVLALGTARTSMVSIPPLQSWMLYMLHHRDTLENFLGHLVYLEWIMLGQSDLLPSILYRLPYSRSAFVPYLYKKSQEISRGEALKRKKLSEFSSHESHLIEAESSDRSRVIMTEPESSDQSRVIMVELESS